MEENTENELHQDTDHGIEQGTEPESLNVDPFKEEKSKSTILIR